jgi:amino acid efflux transporter
MPFRRIRWIPLVGPDVYGVDMSGRLSLVQGTAICLGAVLGTGVIGLPALGADIAGPASLLAWAGLIVLSIPLAATFAALGARHPDSGGVSTYVRRAFGARTAAVVGWCFYFAVPTGAPAAAMFGGAYVAAAIGGGLRTTLIAAGVMIALVVAANLGGVQVSGRLQVVLASLLVLLLVTATATSLPHARLANLHPFAPHGYLAIASAAGVLVWGFAGWEAMTSLAADFRRPERDITRATALALVFVAVLYLGVATASILVLGPATGSSPAPLSDLLSIGIGGPVKSITAVAAVVMSMGAMNAYFAGAAKLGAALGRDGALPAWFAHGSSVGEVPRRSLLVTAALAGLALGLTTLTGVGLRPSVLLTTGSFVLVYVLGTAAALRLLPRGTWSRRAAVIALASAVALVFMTGVYMVWALAIAGAALAYVRWSRRAVATTEEPTAGTRPPGSAPVEELADVPLP